MWLVGDVARNHSIRKLQAPRNRGNFARRRQRLRLQRRHDVRPLEFSERWQGSVKVWQRHRQGQVLPARLCRLYRQDRERKDSPHVRRDICRPRRVRLRRSRVHRQVAPDDGVDTRFIRRHRRSRSEATESPMCRRESPREDGERHNRGAAQGRRGNDGREDDGRAACADRDVSHQYLRACRKSGHHPLRGMPFDAGSARSRVRRGTGARRSELASCREIRD